MRDADHKWQWLTCAKLSEVDRICNEARDLLNAYSLGSNCKFAVELLLREALNNAVIHGSKNDPGKELKCEMEITPIEIILKVIDQGPGFNWPAALAMKQHSVTETGRGIAVFQSYATSFTFNQSGNCITIRRAFATGERI